jgi:hypothetical protein
MEFSLFIVLYSFSSCIKRHQNQPAEVKFYNAANKKERKKRWEPQNREQRGHRPCHTAQEWR